MSVVGLDIGDAKSCVAVARRNGVDVLLNKESKRETPVIVSFGQKQRAIGCDGSSAQSMNPKNTVFGIKRLIGKNFKEASVQEELQYFPYKVIEGPDGKCLIEVSYLNEKALFSPERVMAMILTDLRLLAEKEMDGIKVTDCVVSVPNYYTERERCAMLDAIEIAGLNCLRLIPDTTASALAFGIYKTDLSETDPLNVAFVDVGHSSLQVCVAAFKKGCLTILSQTYDTQVGGRSFDNMLFEHFCEQFKNTYKLDVKSHARATLRLRNELTKVKKILSANSSASFSLECFMNDVDVKGSIQREEFESMASSVLEKIVDPCARAVEEAGLKLEQISAVELVGSASRIPSVASRISEFFGKEISRTMNIAECVSKGCALQCAMLSPVFRVREFEIQDICLHDINFTWKKENEDTITTSTVFPKINTKIPSIKMLTFIRNESFSLDSSYGASDSLPHEMDAKIGHYDIGPIKVPKGAEKAKLKVQVRLNLHGVVEVFSVQAIEEEEYEVEVLPEKSKEEKTSGDEEMKDATDSNEDGNEEKEKEEKEKKEEEAPPSPKKETRKRTLKTDVPFTSKSLRIPKDVLNGYRSKEVMMIESDVLQEMTKDARNSLESYILSIRNRLYESLGEYATEEERSSFSKKLDEMEDWMYDEGEDETKNVYLEKLTYLKGFGDPIEERYSESGRRGPASQSLIQVCNLYSSLASSEDPKYSHITDEEKARVTKECQSAMQWLSEKQAMQDSMPKHVPPALMSYDITKKMEVVERVCKPIMSKPAPKPKEEEKKKEEEETPMQTDSKAEENGTTPMDASNTDDVD